MTGFLRLAARLSSAYESINGTRWAKIAVAALVLIAVARILHAHFMVPLRRCGDEYGYIFFQFDDLASALSGIRAPGFPIVVKFYEALFPHFGYWPMFQVGLFSLAVLWLYVSLIGSNVRPLSAFAVCAPLFLSGPALTGAPFICSDGTAGTFVVATAAAIVNARRLGGVLPLVVLGVLAAMTVLIRPAFLPLIPVLFIAWIVMGQYDAATRPFRERFRALLAFGLVLLVPLGLFVGYRYVMTGHVGVTALGQILLGGHATAYLNKDHIDLLDGDARALAEKILDRRARLAAPCTLATNENVGSRFPDDWLEGAKFEHQCYGAWYHTAMLAAIEIGTEKLPRPDTGGVYEPWPPSGSSTRHPPPAAPAFGDPEPWSWGGDRWLHEEVFTGDGGRPAVYFDSLLGRYNKAILGQERGLYLRWLAGEAVIAGGEMTRYLAGSRAIRWGSAVIVALVAAGITVLLISRRRVGAYLQMLFRRPNAEERTMLVFATGLPVLTAGLTISIVYIYDRYLDAPAVFVPALIGLVCLRFTDALFVALRLGGDPGRVGRSVEET